jgi:hypothetical protein
MLKLFYIVVAIAGILFIDCWFSLVTSCYPIDEAATNSAYSQYHCTAFDGPVFILLRWFLKLLHDYENKFVAGFTIVLAFSTIGLWFSTRHLWIVTKAAVDLANREFISSHRPKMRLKHAWFTEQLA